jgi:hypothetical protein
MNDGQTTGRTGLAYLTVPLDNTHPVPVSWDSQDSATGQARVLIDLDARVIYRMEMVVDGLFADGDPAAQNVLQDNVTTTQPFHFHNLPQGGPTFFVQQLFDTDPETGEITTATLENTATGLRFAIDETYALRAPVNNPDLADVVATDILAGNGYLGLHTAALPVPATAVAGKIHAFGTGGFDGRFVWEGDDNDLGLGSRRDDLLSMGGGADLAFGGGGDDVLDGGSGDDRLLAGGGDDTIWSGSGDDSAVGGWGDDLIYGNDGDDRLLGAFGADTLDGGAGDDRLAGGVGDDMLTGGAGADLFVFTLFNGDDTITDFDIAEDRLVLAGPQRLVDASLADLDGDGAADDTALTLIGGTLSVLDADLSAAWL